MNGRMLNMLLAEDNIGGIFGAFPIIKTIMIVIMILCALFIICVVLFQPSQFFRRGRSRRHDGNLFE